MNKPFTAAVGLLLIYVAAMAANDDLKTAITSFPDVTASKYRANLAVASANMLISAGEDAAWGALEFAALNQPDDKASEQICHLCRLLFVSTNSASPLRAPRLGASCALPYNAMIPADWPVLPFVIVNDVPLSMNLGYNLGGVPERAAGYLAYCRANGKFRSGRFPTPTFVTASNALTRVFESKAWKGLKWEDGGEGWHYKYDEAYAREMLWKQVENMREPSRR